MLLQYSFRKSFLISSPPLKPDQHPIQQLLPPQIPSASLVKTYSFSQLGSNNVGQGVGSNFIVNNNNNSKKSLLQANNNISNGNNSSNIINNESSSFNEPYSEIQLQLPTTAKNNLLSFAAGNNKRMEQLEGKNQQLINQLQAERKSNKELKEENKKLRQDYESLLKIHNLKQKDSFVKDEKKELMKKIADYEQQLAQMRKEIAQKNDQLSVYEMRSEQSRRLLQKLNENINKKEAKLIKDKQTVTQQLQRVNTLLQQSKSRQRQKDHQLLSLEQKYKRTLSQSLSTSHQLSQRQRNTIVAQYQSKLHQKITEINHLMDRFVVIENEHREEIGRLRECLGENQSNRTSMSEGLIRLQEDHLGKEHQIEKLEEVVGRLEGENGRLREDVQHLTHELQSQALQHQTQSSSARSKQSQLQLHLTNSQFLIKQTQQKLSFLEQQNQRINQLVNQLKEDKRLFQREKEELKTIVNEKTSQIEQLKSKLQQSREMEIKYKVIIENYERQQERVYERENEQQNTIAMHEVRIKSQNIDIQKLNLLISQKQSEINHANLNCDKFRKLYQQQKLMLAMYKQQTAKAKQNTQVKWKELKHYYETQIQLLQQKIKDLQTSISSSESRTRIRNILQNSDVKARIVTSRVVTGRQRLIDKEESDIDGLNMLSTERENHYYGGEKKRGQQQLLYKVGDGDNDDQLKENYWHGLNNDSMDHGDEEINKN